MHPDVTSLWNQMGPLGQEAPLPLGQVLLDLQTSVLYSLPHHPCETFRSRSNYHVFLPTRNLHCHLSIYRIAFSYRMLNQTLNFHHLILSSNRYTLSPPMWFQQKTTICYGAALWDLARASGLVFLRLCNTQFDSTTYICKQLLINAILPNWLVAEEVADHC